MNLDGQRGGERKRQNGALNLIDYSSPSLFYEGERGLLEYPKI